MAAWYNEIDPFAAQWLRNLIAAGHIAPGDVDERSIVDVQPDDLRGYTQCHFFAGLGGWSHALRLAAWADDRFVWSGSPPCQPLSCAGQRFGHVDERHLWPAFYRLIAERRPSVVFGEQTSGKMGLEWLAAVRADLEGLGYAVGAANLPACGVGAPHIRNRLWFVADGAGDGWRERRGAGDGAQGRAAGFKPSGDAGLVADADEGQRGRLTDGQGRERDRPAAGWLEGYGQPQSGGFWSDCVWLPCTDGKARPVEFTRQRMAPGLFDSLGYVCAGDGYTLSPLTKGEKNRVGRLRAYGNSIVPQVAAEFIRACA